MVGLCRPREPESLDPQGNPQRRRHNRHVGMTVDRCASPSHLTLRILICQERTLTPARGSTSGRFCPHGSD
jgi:hypothetical protein